MIFFFYVKDDKKDALMLILLSIEILPFCKAIFTLPDIFKT